MREQCLVCNQKNRLTYFKEGQMLSCNDYGAISTEDKFNEKHTFHKEGYKPSVIEKIKALIHIHTL